MARQNLWIPTSCGDHDVGDPLEAEVRVKQLQVDHSKSAFGKAGEDFPKESALNILVTTIMRPSIGGVRTYLQPPVERQRNNSFRLGGFAQPLYELLLDRITPVKDKIKLSEKDLRIKQGRASAHQYHAVTVQDVFNFREGAKLPQEQINGNRGQHTPLAIPVSIHFIWSITDGWEHESGKKQKAAEFDLRNVVMRMDLISEFKDIKKGVNSTEGNERHGAFVDRENRGEGSVFKVLCNTSPDGEYCERLWDIEGQDNQGETQKTL
ncbi:hypothetical protein BJ165DRAFT_1410991 [Panaeolus papilionaceus]|nr:hypothetical protein BJ165DRAFT_1410991 [Panaeolus papilionaceus]